jgi:tetratricopeptide (TPR) repeat protein
MLSAAFLLLLALSPAFGKGKSSAKRAAPKKEIYGVGQYSQQERRQGLEKVTQDLAEKLKLKNKDIRRLYSRLDKLEPDNRGRMIDYMIEVRKRKLELADEKLSPLDKMRIKAELRELYDGMAEEDEEFTDFLSKTIENAQDRSDYSQGLAHSYPDNAQYQARWAQDLFDTGDVQGSIEAANRAIELDSGSPAPYAVLALAKLSQGDSAGAYEDARRAMEIDPRNPSYQSVMKLAESRRSGPAGGASPAQPPSPEPDSAVPVFSRPPAPRPPGPPSAAPFPGQPPGPASPEDPARASRYAKEAEILLRGRRFEDAVRVADAAVRLDPRNVAAFYYKAWGHAGMRDWASARRDAEEALRIAPENARLLSLYSGVLGHQREYADALGAADRSIRSDPNLAEAFFHKSLALAGLGRREEALLSLSEAVRLNPQYQGYYRKAVDLPQASDLALLLSGEAPLQAAPAQAPAPSPVPARRLLILGLGILIGGFLIALGLLHLLTSEGRRRIKDLTASMSRRGAPRGRDESLPATISGVYQVRRKIGIGGMGVVYEAFDSRLERKVAIKKMREEIRSDPRESARFLQEARMVAALHHPNIVEIHAIVEEGSDLYLVFEHVDGRTVHELLSERKRLPMPEAMRILHGCCAALDYAHKKGVIHRDLKPSNVMLDKENTVKVMDFGVARQAKDSITRLSMTNTVVGTPPYMAPEQEQGAVCKESDVFALGVLLYEMVTGQLPFAGVGAGMLLGKMNKTYVQASRMAPGLPPGFDEAMGEALEPDPVKRLHTAADFYRRIAGLTSA